MLDDDEWKRVRSLLNTGTEGDKRQRMFAAALREYERITGFHITNPKMGPCLIKVGSPLRKMRETSKNAQSQAVRFMYAPS